MYKTSSVYIKYVTTKLVASSTVSCIGLGWIGSHTMDPWTTLVCGSRASVVILTGCCRRSSSGRGCQCWPGCLPCLDIPGRPLTTRPGLSTDRSSCECPRSSSTPKTDTIRLTCSIAQILRKLMETIICSHLSTYH